MLCYQGNGRGGALRMGCSRCHLLMCVYFCPLHHRSRLLSFVEVILWEFFLWIIAMFLFFFNAVFADSPLLLLLTLSLFISFFILRLIVPVVVGGVIAIEARTLPVVSP